MKSILRHGSQSCNWTATNLDKCTRECFFKLGLCIGEYPWVFLLLPLLLALVLSPGWLYFREVSEEDIRNQFAPIGSPSRREFDIAAEFFQSKGKPFWFTLYLETKDGGSLLRPEHLEATINLTDYFHKQLTVSYEDQNYTYSDICGTHCDDNRAASIFLKIFHTNSTHSRIKLNFPILEIYNHQNYLGHNFFGIEFENNHLPNHNSAIDSNTKRVSGVRLLQMTYRASISSDLLDKVSHLWDIEMDRFSRNFDHPLLRLTATSHRIINEEIKRSALEYVPLIPIAGIVITAFVILTNLQLDPIRTKFWEAILGVACPGMALWTGFALVFFAGYQFNFLVLTGPFLVLTIGVDDCFLMFQGWRLTSTALSPQLRLAETLRNVGPSISITSFTNILSFALGNLSPTRSIQVFCTFLSVSLAMDYFYQITFFSAVMLLGGRREAKGLNAYFGSLCSRVKLSKNPSEVGLNDSAVSDNSSFRDVVDPEKSSQSTELSSQAIAEPDSLPSTDRINKTQEIKNGLTNLFRSYSDFLTTWAGRAFVGVILMFYWSFAIYGSLQMNTGLSAGKLAPGFFLTSASHGAGEWSVRARLLLEWREIVGRKEFADFNASVFEDFNFYTDSYLSIGSITLQTVGITFVVMLGVCVFFIPNLLSIFCAAVAMLSINIGVFGYLALWSVNLDPISLGTILMSIGFSVDYTAHISYHYFKCREPNPKERLWKALSSVGWPTLQAACSTLLGVSLLATVSSYTAQVFMKTVAIVIVFGLLHGMCFLPVVLVALSAHPAEITEKDCEE